MKKHLLTTGLMAILLLSGCSSSTPAVETDTSASSTTEIVVESETPQEAITELIAETEDYPALKKLIIETYDIPEDYLETSKYYYNYVDLNNDGAKEIFVVVMGPYTSGSGGSSGMIVYPVGDELHVNQEFTLLRTPIIISDQVTNGAKELILLRSGGGIEAGYVKLSASDGYYTTVNDGQSIENLDGITGTAILSNDLVADIENGNFLTLK